MLNRCPNARVLLTEGGPDFVSAIYVLEEVENMLPIGMLGSAAINETVRPKFKGRAVVVAAHQDENGKGMETARKWAEQLRAVGARVVAMKFGAGDLNDAIRAGELAEIRGILNGIH